MLEFLSHGNEKFLNIDLEADVYAENEVYCWILNTFSEASNGYFMPTEIQENWITDKGPISVNFISDGKEITFEPEYMDDWIDSKIFDLINIEMKKKSNEFFILCSGPDDDWFGQNAIFIRLNEHQRDILKNTLNWNFPED